VIEANKFKVTYCKEMNQLLRILETHEEQRLETFKGSVEALIIYETSKEMNNKYDAKSF
jgi:hypothetical protein